jgi:hypothetical protein
MESPESNGSLKIPSWHSIWMTKINPKTTSIHIVNHIVKCIVYRPSQIKGKSVRNRVFYHCSRIRVHDEKTNVNMTMTMMIDVRDVVGVGVGCRSFAYADPCVFGRVFCSVWLLAIRLQQQQW